MLQVTRQSLLGLDQGKGFAQCAADITQLHVLPGLNAEQHLRDELPQRLWLIVAQLKREFRQLSFQTRADFAIVHRGRLRANEFSWSKIPSTTDCAPSNFSPAVTHSIKKGLSLPSLKMWDSYFP
jgi:hypothetical protein